MTIVIGPNDLCLASAVPGDTVTPVNTFQSAFQTAMSTLMDGNPNKPRVFVSSVANPAHLYDALKSPPGLAAVNQRWTFYQFCGNVTGYSSPFPSGPFTGPEDPSVVATRAAASTRSAEYSAALQTVCAGYAPYCKFDGGAVNNYPTSSFTLADFSTQDYWHPSISGQAGWATLLWNAGFHW